MVSNILINYIIMEESIIFNNIQYVINNSGFNWDLKILQMIIYVKKIK